MKIYTKTFNIGEYAEGGKIKATIVHNGREITLTAATSIRSKVVDYRELYVLELFLQSVTSSYYASKIHDWFLETLKPLLLTI